MRQETRSRIATGLDRAHLLRPAARLREGWLAARGCDGGTVTAPDGLPLPPSRLRLLVDGRSGDAARFLAVGERMAGSIAAAVAHAGPSLERMGAILDFGCGSGRVARHWAGLDGPEVHGCDYNRELVAWCGDNLPFLYATRNELEPPTPYVAGSFDLVYALSVFSHLSEPIQRAWTAEFRRILRPGGLLVVSVLGEAARDRLAGPARERFERGEMVVERPRMAGSNACTVYHPRRYVLSALLGEFDDVLPFDLGSPDLVLLQDAYIARRSA